MSDARKPMTDDELDAIQGRLAAITSEALTNVHWKANSVGKTNSGFEYFGIEGVVDAGLLYDRDYGYENGLGIDGEMNAAFIANAPTDIARLLAENERLRSEVARLDKEADWLVGMLSHYTEDCPLKFSWVYEEIFPIPKIDGCDGSWPDDDYFDCTNSTPEKCWREAARKAVEEEND